MSSDLENQTVTGSASRSESLDIEKRAGEESSSSRISDSQSANKVEEKSVEQQEKNGISIESNPVAPPPSDIPNGGFVAWLQCANAFFLFFNSWGIVNTYGNYDLTYLI